MKIACSTAAFKTDLDTALAAIARLGFSHVDLIAIKGWDHVNLDRLTADYPAESGRVKSLLAKHGLTPIAFNFAVDTKAVPEDAAAAEARGATVGAVCRLMRELGVEVAGFYPGYFDGTKPWCPPREVAVRNALAAYRQMLAIAAGTGVVIGPEPHCGTMFETPEQVRELFAAMPGMPVVFDPSHFLMQGIDLAEVEFILPKACHMHLRGAASDRMQAPFAQCPLDLEWLAAKMRETGYRGAISLEYLPDFPGDIESEIVALRDRFAALAG